MPRKGSCRDLPPGSDRLARLRVLLSSSTAQDAPALLERESDHIRAVAHALFSLSTLWEGMKPLLLLVRAAPIPIFAADLSWWTVKAPMTNGVGSLANAMMFYFQSYARFEQNSDEPGLLSGVDPSIALSQCIM